jgi:hypothetical protein
MKTLNGAPDFLPNLIRAIGDRFMRYADGPEKSREAVTEILIQTIIVRCANPTNLAVAPTRNQCKELDSNRIEHATLAVALYVDADDVVESILSAGIDPWTQSSLFKPPIEIAARMNSATNVQKILLVTDKIHAGHLSQECKHNQARIIFNAIEAAARYHHWSVAEQMMMWSAEHLAKPSLSQVGYWIRVAVASSSLNALRTIRGCGYLQHSMRKYAVYIVYGLVRNANPEPILRFCIKEGLFFENDPSEYGRDLLNEAVYHESTGLARAAFAVNAYADCPTALRVAIKKGDAPMVRVLLDHGVDPEARMHQPPERTTCELACKYPASEHPEIRYLLCRAIKEKMKALGSNYRAPHQITRASPKDKWVLVAYTFHAPTSGG